MGGKTSTASKVRWMRENYKILSVNINKDDGELFAEKCKKDGITMADVIRPAIYEYLGKPMPPSKARF